MSVVITVTRPLPPSILAKVNAGVMLAAEQWGVTLPTPFSFRFDPKEGKLTANRKLSIKTKVCYYGIYLQFWCFCAWTGDYASMLIFLHPAVKKFPAINVETLELFLRFKCKPKGDELESAMASVDIFTDALQQMASGTALER